MSFKEEFVLDMVPMSNDAVTKGVPTISKMEEFVSDMGQSGILAVMKDVPIKQRREESVSDTEQSQNEGYAQMKDVPIMPSREEYVLGMVQRGRLAVTRDPGGVCRRHGATFKTCSHKGCNNSAKVGGVCWRHGTRKRSSQISHHTSILLAAHAVLLLC